MTFATRVARAAALPLVLWAAAVATSLGCGGEQPITMAELAALGEAEHKRILLGGIAEGRLLYFKNEQYQLRPQGRIPQRMVVETWQGVGPDGKMDRSVSVLWLEDGPETVDHGGGLDQPAMVEFLDQAWNLPKFLESAGFELKGRGALHGMESAIYELKSESSFERIEFALDAPLIAQNSSFEIDPNGDHILVSQNTALDYALLPAGSEPPAVD